MTYGHSSRRHGDPLQRVQVGNRDWWESTPMTYDWRDEAGLDRLTEEWFDDQDRRNADVHRHFATRVVPFDRLIPYDDLAGRDVLEIGVGSGFHAELMARAGARVTDIDLTDAAVETTRRRFELRGLEGVFEQRDAEETASDFSRRFDFVWSWGVIHHSARTARVVRNIASWLKDDGGFAGMVYHRDSFVAAATVARSWLLQRKLLAYSIDEALWDASDGFTARFYPAEQWCDLLLGFFDAALIGVNGQDTDVVPLPRGLRNVILPFISRRRRDCLLRRAGTFVTFRADGPLR